jgi:hypothetical protein
MGLHLAIRCDATHDDAAGVQLVSFDDVTETFGDLIAHLRAHGWHVELGESARVVTALCPEHASQPA